MLSRSANWAEPPDADLTRASLGDADLTGAVLDDANLTWARLDGAVLYGAVLDGADLTRAWLNDANLTGAQLGANPPAVPPGWVITDAMTGELRPVTAGRNERAH